MNYRQRFTPEWGSVNTSTESVEKVARKKTKKAFIFRYETFGDLESALEDVFTHSATSSILYVAAEGCGRRSFQRIMQKANSKEEALQRLIDLKKRERWGNIQFQQLDLKKASGKVIIQDSFETIARKTSKPSCHFFRGFLAGVLSEFFQKKITVVEERCAGEGAESCEFTFQ